MRTIIYYLYAFLTDGASIILMLLPIYLLARMLYLTIHTKNRLEKTFRIDRELICLAFFLFLTMLFTQTFIVNSGINEIKLIPFEVIIRQITEVNDDIEGRQAFIFNIIGNIAIFVPVGFLASAVFRKGLGKTILVCFFISLFIEVFQIPLDRVTDVDDLILNTTGAAIGCLIYNAIQKTGQRSSDGKKRRNG